MTTTYRNKKTGLIYVLLYEAIDCTNSRDGNIVVVYYQLNNSPHKYFVRDKTEFEEKFELVEYGTGIEGQVNRAQAEVATWPEIVRESTNIRFPFKD